MTDLCPFTLEEATEIWDDFEDLKDTEFILETVEYFVHDVVISPFEEGERLAFIARYDATQDGRESLAGYAGTEFDVMLVACDVSDESMFVYIDIRSFAAEKGISYGFPERA